MSYKSWGYKTKQCIIYKFFKWERLKTLEILWKNYNIVKKRFFYHVNNDRRNMQISCIHRMSIFWPWISTWFVHQTFSNCSLNWKVLNKVHYMMLTLFFQIQLRGLGIEVAHGMHRTTLSLWQITVKSSSLWQPIKNWISKVPVVVCLFSLFCSMVQLIKTFQVNPNATTFTLSTASFSSTKGWAVRANNAVLLFFSR